MNVTLMGIWIGVLLVLTIRMIYRTAKTARAVKRLTQPAKPPPQWENYDRHTNVVGYSRLDVENWR